MKDLVQVGRHLFGYDYGNLKIIDVQSYYDNPWDEDAKFQACDLVIARTPMGAVGFGAYTHNCRHLQLKRLAVTVGRRREGIGRRIVQFIVDEAKDTGIRKITTIVNETNLASQLFLREMGFKAVFNMKERDQDDRIFFKRTL